jgi:hypothetical protein
VPISQGGSARAISVGALLASTQSALVIDSGTLLGRTSLGSGSPEQVDLGAGINLSGGTLIADGLDHGGFPVLARLSANSDLVISNQGSPMLLQASLLRGLFSAGDNVSIDPSGVISSSLVNTTTGTVSAASSVAELQPITNLAPQDLVAVSHDGLDYAVAYSNFLDGVTIDRASAAGPSGASDTIWVGQGSSVMVRQTFAAIWQWIAGQLPTYPIPNIEITADATLSAATHNGCLLVCSQPVIVQPAESQMGSGFQCQLINASGGNVTLGPGFVSSTGSFSLAPWQSATLSCISYSGGLIAFAAMPTVASGSALPGQPGSVAASSITPTALTVSWLPPSAGGIVSWYIVQSRRTGTASWTSSPPVTNGMSYELTSLQPATSYDITVEAQNSAGLGIASLILTVATASLAQSAVPPQITGVTATTTSSSNIQIDWVSQTGAGAATSFTIQYRVTGSSNWTFSVAGLTGTSYAVSGLQASTHYDFCVFGVNSQGAGPASSILTAATLAASAAVMSITWNLTPSGTYTHGSGTIGVNAQVSPVGSPIQFGFSLSSTVRPGSWTAAILVNGNLWGAYAPTPATAGSYYAWAEGLDGSAPTVSPNPFIVQ